MADQTNSDRERARGQTLQPDLIRLMELVVTRHLWAKGLSAKRMQAELAAVLDDGRRHLVIVRKGRNGRPEIEFDPALGDIEAAFTEAAKSAPSNRPS